jgi:uncharacterized protein (TIGR00255 family)
MIKSMTGFGRAAIENENLSVRVEVKSLNSKFFDQYIKLGNTFADKEIDVKNLLTQQLERGKISLTINYQSRRAEAIKFQVNKDLVSVYYQELSLLADSLGADKSDIFRFVLQMPDATAREENEETRQEDWKIILQAIEQAVKACDQFRIEEGRVLARQLKEGIEKIQELLVMVQGRDPERMVKIREKLQKQVADLVSDEHFDPNRFEQELIYYIEKLDITEEKIRLGQHLSLFMENLQSPQSNGRKLNFISQEIGREINTIGAKANDYQIQKMVIDMKDELEKIKEQLNNIL